MTNPADLDSRVRSLMKTGLNYNPYEHASLLGIHVLFREIQANGYWLPSHHTIVLQTGLASWAARSTLAHEIGHAVHDHGHTFRGNPDEEFIADRYAAEMLTTPTIVSRALRTSSDVLAAARQMKITTRMLRALYTPLREPTPSELLSPWAE